jgi:hypothetical protein
MILIQDKLVSEELFEEEFVCNLTACKGACCVEGEGGAPLEESELQVLKQEFKHYKEFLTEEGKKELKSQGYWIEEEWNGEKIWSTPLMDNHGACAYVVYENGIALCGIEKAWKAGKTNFRKPVSCHLYPIRVQTLKNGTEALNYNRWKICGPACSNGKKLGVPVYQFLQEAIIRRYGEAFYAELDEVGKQWRGNKHHNI